MSHKTAFHILLPSLPNQLHLPHSLLEQDLEKCLENATSQQEARMIADIEFLMSELEQYGIKTPHAHAVSPHNEGWFVLFEVIKGIMAFYVFLDADDNIYLYHAKIQSTAAPDLVLLKDGLKIMKALLAGKPVFPKGTA